jgi:hypothetical protein
MVLHEKTLESMVNHELLNLADSWYWFLTDIPLWQYWRPRYRLPFIPYPKSTSAGFHINIEGKDDPTGNAGGGFDIRIKAGNGGHLLFIQYKKGTIYAEDADPGSIFSTPPKEHYRFDINTSSTNQHFVLRNLAKGIGSAQYNAVVYGFPLIKDMDDLEAKAGRIIRHTKFVSVTDIDTQARIKNIEFKLNEKHSFRICSSDMNKCELNLLLLLYDQQDRTPAVIADAIALGFRRITNSEMEIVVNAFKQYKLELDYLSFGLSLAFGEFLRYLAHYFEVDPRRSIVARELYLKYNPESTENEYANYRSDERSISIVERIFEALGIFQSFIDDPIIDGELTLKIREYEPALFMPLKDDGINIRYIPVTSENPPGDIVCVRI